MGTQVFHDSSLGNDGSKGLSESHTILSNNTDANQANGNEWSFYLFGKLLTYFKTHFPF